MYRQFRCSNHSCKHSWSSLNLIAPLLFYQNYFFELCQISVRVSCWCLYHNLFVCNYYFCFYLVKFYFSTILYYLQNQFFCFSDLIIHIPFYRLFQRIIFFANILYLIRHFKSESFLIFWILLTNSSQFLLFSIWEITISSATVIPFELATNHPSISWDEIYIFQSYVPEITSIVPLLSNWLIIHENPVSLWKSNPYLFPNGVPML
jgi:hypothetical protein